MLDAIAIEPDQHEGSVASRRCLVGMVKRMVNQDLVFSPQHDAKQNKTNSERLLYNHTLKNDIAKQCETGNQLATTIMSSF